MAQEAQSSDKMKTILVFEPLSGGHRANFIRWLMDAVPEYAGCRFVFFTADEVSDSVSCQLLSAGRWKKQRLLYQLFRQACREYSPDHVLILELTQLELALALHGAPCPVSAILFVQYPELPHGLKFFIKEWKTALLLRRAPVRNLFLLNGEESCRYLASRFGARTRFVSLPDPVPDVESDAGFSIRDVYEISADRTIFLFFGAISPRKGSHVLIEALQLLPPETAARSAFVFCGEPERSYRKMFGQTCARLRTVRPDIKLNIENHFVSDQRMMALFEQSDVVLMPYTRPEYSSGILALAATAGTPVIGPAGGLLGRLIRDNGLGVTCPGSPANLSEAIISAVVASPVVDSERCAAFVKKSRPEQFARMILKAICNEG
jgi:glycosyltransferase involved in cell wall biosynthesis